MTKNGPEFKKKDSPKVIPKFKRIGEQMEPVKLAPKVAKKISLPPPAKPYVHVVGRVVAIPSGDPLCKPSKYGPNLDTPWYKAANPWPEGFPSNEEVIEWAHRIKDMAKEKSESLLPSAIVYYAMHFWDSRSSEFAKVKELINSNT